MTRRTSSKLILGAVAVLGLGSCGWIREIFGPQQVLALVDNRLGACDRLDYTVKLINNTFAPGVETYSGSVERFNGNPVGYVVYRGDPDYTIEASLGCVIGQNTIPLAGSYTVDTELNSWTLLVNDRNNPTLSFLRTRQN